MFGLNPGRPDHSPTLRRDGCPTHGNHSNSLIPDRPWLLAPGFFLICRKSCYYKFRIYFSKDLKSGSQYVEIVFLVFSNPLAPHLALRRGSARGLKISYLFYRLSIRMSKSGQLVRVACATLRSSLSFCVFCFASHSRASGRSVRGMVGLAGLEPATPRLSSVCSNQLSYRPRW